MKILISGATGFIGKNLSSMLSSKGHDICALVRVSTNIDSLQKEKVRFYTFDDDIDKLRTFMEKEKFDGVIHLASLFLASHESKDIKNLIDSNVYLGTAILEAASKSGINWFLNTGTFWQHYKNKDYSPVNLYAATKQAFDDIAKYYIETSRINFVTIKLSDTFGPNDTRNKIFNTWDKISKSGEFLDMSKGAQIIDINYIDNVIDGYTQMIDLLAKDKKGTLSGKSFAISAKERLSLKELAKIFEKVTKQKLHISWGKKEYRLREVMVPWEHGKKIPGWKQKISIAEGIEKTINSVAKKNTN